MARITEYDLSDYGVLLGTDRIDASKGALFIKKSDENDSGGVAPNKNAVTILIGMGGIGVQTLDYIKGKAMNVLDDSWRDYLALLAIDADTTEINRTAYLSRNDEWIELRDDNIKKKAAGEVEWPRAWKPMVSRETLSTLTNAHLQKPGSGRMRLMGKLKLHNNVANAMKAYDERIVERLKAIKGDKTSARYEIYVVGSACGGTCSGGFLEMPALIRHAFKDVSGVTLYGMLFLPDTLSRNGSIHAPNEIIGNGFATLKEFDYFSGMTMRDNMIEKWHYNEDATPELVLDDKFSFYDLPYLIGTQNGATSDSTRQAQETVAEFLLSLLGEYTVQNGDGSNFVVDAAVSNMGKYQNDHPVDSEGRIPRYESHSRPKVYGAIGFGEYAAPVKVVRSYVVANACEKAGIKGVDQDEWDRANDRITSNDGEALLPFRNGDVLEDALTGQAQAARIVAPLEEALKNIIYGSSIAVRGFTRPGRNRPQYTFDWENVYRNSLYNRPAFIQDMESIVTSKTEENAIEEMKLSLIHAYQTFEQNVLAYVLKEGPAAFANLFTGKFIPVDGRNGIGIRAMLNNIMHGKLLDGTEYLVKSANEARRDLDRALSKLVREVSLLRRAGRAMGIHDDRATLVSTWERAYGRWLDARVNEAYAERTLGNNRILHQEFVLRAERLYEDIRSFGHILDSMTSAYKSMGKVMDDFTEFAKSGDNASEVNLASINTRSYEWIKKQANAQLVGITGRQIREELVNSFFQNRELWLSVPEDRVVRSNGNLSLVNRDWAVPARECFDKCISKVVPNTLDVSISSLFEQSAQSDTDYTTIAVDILNKLDNKSKPLFNGEYSVKYIKRSIMYPSSLNNTESGKKAVAALRAAAKTRFSDNNEPVDVFGSADTNTIRMYQFATPLEMYKLKELEDWERIYEQELKGPNARYMHANSPTTECVREGRTVTYVERRSWMDYPSPVVYKMDPRMIVDSRTGEICREGKRRIEIDKMIARAREIGVLYSEYGVMGAKKGYMIKLAEIGKDWKLHKDNVNPGADGLYRTKVALIEELLENLGGSQHLADISRTVFLKNARLLSEAVPEEEDAWEYAAETLYSHVRMYHDLEDSVERFEAFHESIVEQNRVVLRQRMPAMFPHIIRAGHVFQESNNWYFRVGHGKQQFLNLQEARIKRLPMTYRDMLNDGMTYAYVYMKLLDLDPERMNDDIYMKLYSTSTEEYGKLLDLSDFGDIAATDTLDAWDARVDDIQAEIDSIGAKFGIEYREEPDSRSNQAACIALQKKMNNSEEGTAIFEFYYKAAQWNN